MPNGFGEYREGNTILVVPDESLTTSSPPSVPAFFNPKGRMVRDIAVIAYSSYSGKGRTTLLDPLAGVGAKAIRTLVEGDGVSNAIINDLNPTALEAAKATARLNGIADRLEVNNDEANSFLALRSKRELRADIIDIDPFGSPTSYVESAIRALKDGGLLSLTATDTAALSGVYKDVAFRRYFAKSIRADCSKEVALRLLTGMVIRRAMSLDMAAIPVFTHTYMHYMRSYLILARSATKANSQVHNFGYISYCSSCLNRQIGETIDRKCNVCGKNMEITGPVWLGQLFDKEFITSMVSFAEKSFSKYIRMFDLARNEAQIQPLYYRLPDIADRLGRTSPKPDDVIRRLRDLGFQAARSSIEPQGVKTNADITTINSILAEN
ncbi:MAG: tRNA (guanine(10)-N(2))-dimethyltransferase [Conexivisphaerales archaeon]